MMAMQQRMEGDSSGRERVTDSWYTPQDIQETYDSVESETAEWRRRAEERGQRQSIISRLRGLLGGGGEKSFVMRDRSPPRLLVIDDRAGTGSIYFELTEVVGGGTVVKATYNPALERRIHRFRQSLPKLTIKTIEERCPACGRPVHRDYRLCPYCGEPLTNQKG